MRPKALAIGLASLAQQHQARTGPLLGQRLSAVATADEGPTEVVQEAAQGMLAEIDRDREAYRRDPARSGSWSPTSPPTG
jgi:hypothetical protein